MKKIVSGIVCLSALFGMLFWCGAAAIAQDDDTESFELEEIVVTAEKQEANLQKTSISMSVIQGETILNSGSTTLRDVLKVIPNVSTTDSGTAGGLSINIRGLGKDLPVGMGESSVSVNYDGAYEQRGETTLFGFFDVDRVEVLRGPQGTLYGRNASGGVLNIVSSRPRTDKVDGYASLEVAEYKKKKAEAAVNVPMGDSFAGRLAFVSLEQEGTTKDDHGYRNPVSGLATRLQLRYMPNDETSFNLLYNYSKKDGQSWAAIDRDLWDAGIYDVNNQTSPYNKTTQNSIRNTKLLLTAEFSMGPGNVTIIPAYETSKGSSSSYGVSPFAPPGTEPSFSESETPYDYVSNSGEVRYSNKEDSDIKWTIGLFYTETEDPRDPDATRGAGKDFSSKAAFAQVTYPFSDTFRGIAGLRYDDTEKSYYDAINYIKDSSSESYSYYDFKLGIERDFSTDVMAYFTLASGHKAGGFSSDGTPFDEESNISGELGLKSRLLDNRLQVNGDVYYYIYDGYQIGDGYFEEVDGVLTRFWKFFNAGKAETKGAEIEANALLGNGTLFTLNFAYLDNRYTSDFFVHPDPNAPAVNYKGQRMRHSPEFSIQAGLDHMFSLPNGDTLRPSISYRWTDEQYLARNNTPMTLAPAYSVVDISLTYNSTHDWSLNFYANNALDEHYFNGVQNDGAVVFPENPRIMGLILNYRF